MNTNYKNILQTFRHLVILNLFVLAGYGGGLDNTALVIAFFIINGLYILLKLRGKKDDDSLSGIFRL